MSMIIIELIHFLSYTRWDRRLERVATDCYKQAHSSFFVIGVLTMLSVDVFVECIITC